MDTVTLIPSILSFDADSRFIYATTPVWSDKLDRSLVVFDVWAEGPEALFAAGDTLGSNSGGLVKSQGKYVYLFDMFKPRGAAQSKSRLRVFEKANGCKPDPIAPVRLTPDVDAFKLGEEMAVIWAVGCPITVDVAVVQDGSITAAISSQTYGIADDVAYSTTWEVPQLAPDLENHTYQIRVIATYESGPPATFFSKPFRIEVGHTLEVASNWTKPYSTIFSAILAAESGDTVLVYPGDYHEHLTLRSNIRVVGKPGARVIPTTAGPAVTASGLVNMPTLDGLEFRFGSGVDETSLKITDCGVQVRNCKFTELERAVEITNGFGEFTNCEFIDNYNPSVGGAVWINSATTGQTTFTHCTFDGNSAETSAGAVWISSEGSYVEAAPQIKFVDCVFKENSAPQVATVRVGQYTRPTFERCVFVGNSVSGSGSVVGGVGGASAVLTNCTFADNTGTGSHDLLSVEPLSGGPNVTVDASLFANNPEARAISSTYGASYLVSNSDFHGNGTGDAALATSGTGNFSADPAFCGPGDYSIQAYSPCVPGVTVSSLVGARDVGCIPSATITVNPGTWPDTLVVGCPQGDGDSLVVSIDLANSITRSIRTTELMLATPYAPKGIWSTTPVIASGSAVSPNFQTSLRHYRVSGTGDDLVTILLNGHQLAQQPLVHRRSPDISGDGTVNLVDFSIFGPDYPSPSKPLHKRSDFTGDDKVTLPDFAIFNLHNNHSKSFIGNGFIGNSEAEESPAVVSLRFEEFDPLQGEHRLKAIVSLEDAGVFRATLITLSNENPMFRFVEWNPNEGYEPTTMAIDLTKDGQKIIAIGAMGGKYVQPTWVELGFFELEVLSDQPTQPTDEDFALVSAEVLSMAEAIQVVPKQNSRRSYSAPAYQNELRQNYPNPFNPTTTIAFSLARASQAEIKIFDVGGALVKTLINDRRQKGNHRVVWTGDNNQGNHVASGVYFYRLTAGQFRATKKMVLLR